MKRIITFSALLLMFTQPTLALALAGGPTLTALTSASTVAPNGQFTVTVQMDTKTYQVSAAEIHLIYPADKLQAMSVQAGSFLPSVLGAGATGTGTASITVGSGMTPKQGSGPVMLVTFRALAAGTAQIGFASDTQVAAAGQSSNAIDTMTPVSVTVSGTGQMTATPMPTGITGVARVQTGPGETTILALIVGVIAALLYVGYTETNAFRRKEAKSYSEEARNNPPDFRS